MKKTERWLWTQLSDIGPSGRFQHAMAYDEARDRAVLFGGRTAAPPPTNEAKPSDTWEWDGESWVQVGDSGPAGRQEFAMAYDAKRKKIVLFGGWADQLVGDTWEWDGSLWTQVEDSGPPPATGHTMAYDRKHGYVLLYGNHDTWSWDGVRWTQLAETGPASSLGIATYDATHGYVLLGADAEAVGTQLNPSKTWAWDGIMWKQLSDMGPGYITPAACMAFDGKRTVVFVANKRETWDWDGVHWVQRQDIGPGVRISTAMVGDTSRNRCILFGGEIIPSPGSTFGGDTWTLGIDNPPE